MENLEKLKIKDLLIKYCDGYTSQNKAANSLKDVSSATISQIRNGNWALINDKMWLNIGKQVGYDGLDWIDAVTHNYELINKMLCDAKEKSRCHAIIGAAGWGKDTGQRGFKIGRKHVYQVNCDGTMTIRCLLIEILEALGEVPAGTPYKMAKRIVSIMNGIDAPVLILNEYEKLQKKPFMYFITLYNLLENKCGIVLFGTPELEARIIRTDNTGTYVRQGCGEIYSRIGSRFIHLVRPDLSDIAAICEANGVYDANDISEIFNSSGGDQRRVKKLVQNKAKGDKAA